MVERLIVVSEITAVYPFDHSPLKNQNADPFPHSTPLKINDQLKVANPGLLCFYFYYHIMKM